MPHVIKHNDAEKAYKVWITESWRLYCENKCLSTSYLEIIDPPKKAPEDQRSPTEIAHGIWERMRGD